MSANDRIVAVSARSRRWPLATQCLLFALGLWILLGACWTDMAMQDSYGWSPVAGSPVRGTTATIAASNEAIVGGFRGTTPTLRDLQSDLALGLNAAFPFKAFAMEPFLPIAIADQSGLDAADPKHVWFVVGWLGLAVVSLSLLTWRTKRRPTILSALIGLCAVCIGLLIALRFKASGPRAVDVLLFAMLLLGFALCVFAIASAFRIAGRLTLGLWRPDREKTARKQIGLAWIYAAISAGVLGLSAKGAVWLGWYTNDTRINLLEPLTIGAALTAAALAAAAGFTNRRLWRIRVRQLWLPATNTMWFVVIAAVAAIALPNPPRLANWTGEGEYVLVGGKQLASYGDRDASLREGFPRNLRTRANGPYSMESAKPDGRGARSIHIVNFNSANAYSHLFDAPWLQLPLMVLVIGGLATVAVLGSAMAAASLAACVRSVHASAEIAWAAALQIVTLAAFAALLGWVTISAVRSHSMDRVLMHARGEIILNSAYTAFMTYRAGNESSDYWRLPWEDVRAMYLRFDSSFSALVQAEASALQGIDGFGAADNLYFAAAGGLKDRIRRVDWAVRQRQSLFALCETFPDALRFRLERDGFPMPLIDDAVTSWTRELDVFHSTNMVRIRRLSAEADVLSSLLQIEDYWLVDKPGVPPTFGRRDYLKAYLDQMADIIDLKREELQRGAQLQSRLAWIDPRLSIDVTNELGFIESQRRTLSCLSDANQRTEEQGRDFDAAALARECDTAIQALARAR